MAEKLPFNRNRRNHKRFILLLLLLMILANVAVRYPTENASPYGSDTFTMLDLSKHLTEDGRAAWTLTPLSYFGLYPLSYPSGVPFACAELKMLTDLSYDSLPLVVSLVFSTFFVLVGFVFFRQFRLSDTLAAIMAGLMAFSPIFIYFTYEEVTGRGFVLPLFLISLYIIFWSQGRTWSRIVVFALLTFGIFSMHRSSFMILMMELLATMVLFVGPFLPRVRPMAKTSVYAALVVLGGLFLIWPYVPGLREVLGDIPEVAFSYRMGEWQFTTGLLFEGNTLPVLVANLAVNYVGSMGLALLLLPFGLLTLYPSSKESFERDVFPLITLVAFSPMLWQALYMQLMLLPFAYLLIGLAIARRRRFKDLAVKIWRRILPRFRGPPAIPRRAKTTAIALFSIGCVVFSVVLFDHRMNIEETATGMNNWPSGSEINLGNYLREVDVDGHDAFVTASDLLDRRVRWYSEWLSPVSDPVVLSASGYLNATSDDFSIEIDSDNYLYYLLAFFNFKEYYILDPSVPNADLYKLSYEGIYGFFHLYYLNKSGTYNPPGVSAAYAGISVVVEINSMGDAAHNLYFGEGTLKSNFLRDVSTNAYTLFKNEVHSAFLLAQPMSS